MSEPMRAGCIQATCKHCKGAVFRLIGPIPPGMKANVGDQLPVGVSFQITFAECNTCGESMKLHYKGMVV